MMRSWKLSIAGLMGLVLFSAIGFAALSHPTRIWAALLMSSVSAIMTVAVLPAVFMRGPRRAFWTGFAIGGWVYLVMNPGTYGGAAPTPLPNAGLDFLYDLVGPRADGQPVVISPGAVSAIGPAPVPVYSAVPDPLNTPATGTAPAPA